jgi:DNA-binding winged helix-turn-helix (wHTH) protein
MTSALPGPLRFGAFEFNPPDGELRKHGLEVKLTPLAKALLSELIQNPSRILTREELQSRLWPEREFLDFEHGLNKVVFLLRSALGDLGRKSRFIETIPRKGYRFIPTWIQTSGRRATDSLYPSGKMTVAVLPIEVVGTNPEAAIIARLTAAALTDALSVISDLGVLAQGTVRSFNIVGVNPRFAGGAMGVEIVIAGEMIFSDSGIHLRVELIDVSNGQQLCAACVKQIDRAHHDAEELAGIVFRQLQPALIRPRPLRPSENLNAIPGDTALLG